MDEKMLLRNVENSDVDLLFRWANDISVRKNSFHSEIISYEEHKCWFKAMLTNANQWQYILEDDGVPVGQIRAFCQDNQAEIGYSIDSDKRGLGYGKIICQLFIKKIKKEHPEIRKLIARVKPGNVSSVHCFLKNGFVKTFEQYELELKDAYMDDCQFELENPGGVLVLTNNTNTLNLFDWIHRRNNAYLFSERLDVRILDRLRPSIVISYNYIYIISKECIDFMKGNIINMHISLLPWNRGCSPNMWSFIDNTPKGVTIHKVSEGLDEGDILFQEEIEFDSSKETLRSTYNKLNERIVDLFKRHWDEINAEIVIPSKQRGNSTYHTIADFKKLKNKIDFSWDDPIPEFLLKYRRTCQNGKELS